MAPKDKRFDRRSVLKTSAKVAGIGVLPGYAAANRRNTKLHDTTTDPETLANFNPNDEEEIRIVVEQTSEMEESEFETFSDELSQQQRRTYARSTTPSGVETQWGGNTLSAQSGLVETHSGDTRSVEMEAKNCFTETLFVWVAEFTSVVEDEEVIDIEINSYSEDTHFTWSYGGQAGSRVSNNTRWTSHDKRGEVMGEYTHSLTSITANPEIAMDMGYHAYSSNTTYYVAKEETNTGDVCDW